MLTKKQLAVKNGKHVFKLAWERARKLHAIPRYGFLPKMKSKILKLYVEAQLLNLSNRKKTEVDHIIPLKHHYVCGLHTFHNLQLLSKTQNTNKSNTFTPYKEINGRRYYYGSRPVVPHTVNQTKKNPTKLVKKGFKRVSLLAKSRRKK